MSKLKSLPDRYRGILFVLLYGLLAQAPVWLARARYEMVPNGWLCLDYLFIGIGALFFLPRLLAGVLLLATILADLAFAVSITFYLPLEECIPTLSFLKGLAPGKLIAGIAVLFALVLLSSVAVFLPRPAKGRPRWYAAGVLAAICILSLLADGVVYYRAYGVIPYISNGAQIKTGYQLAFMQQYRTGRILVRQISSLLYTERRKAATKSQLTDERVKSVGEVQPAQSVTEMAMREAGIGSGAEADKPNLVVVVVESWGETTNPAVGAELEAPYRQPEIQARYRVVQGTVPFFGSTVAGEGRTLCGTTISYKLLKSTSSDLQNCVPARLNAQGYHSVSLHGMSGDLFDRVHWYSSMGFQEQWFRNQFRAEGLPDCAEFFYGTCDAAIADWIGRRLATQQKQPEFLYWVTLNTHLSLPVPSPIDGDRPCAFSPQFTNDSQVCSWFHLEANVHRAIARMALGPQTRPTVFVVEGDHAPPFGNPSQRALFSGQNVPYLILLPRSSSQPAAQTAAAASGSAKHSDRN
jgi:hypothetical protein